MKTKSKLLAVVLVFALALGLTPAITLAADEPFSIVEARLVTEVLDWGETITALRIEYSDQIWCGDIEYSLEHTDKMTYKMVTGRDIVNLYVNNSGKKDDVQTQGKYVFINFGLERQDFSAYRDVVLFQPGRGTRNQPPAYYFTQSVPIRSSITGKVAPSRTLSTASGAMTAAKNAALPDLNGTPGIGPTESVREVRTASTEVRVTLDKFRTFEYTSPIGTKIKFHLQIPPGYEVPRADNTGEPLPMVVHFPNGGDMNYLDDTHVSNAADRRLMGALYSHPEATYWATDEAQERNPSFVMSLSGTSASNYGTEGRPAANWGNWYQNSRMQQDYVAAIRWVKDRFNVDVDRVGIINLAASADAVFGTVLDDSVDDFSALVLTAYDHYHSFASGTLGTPIGGTAQTTYLGRMKYAEEQIAKVMKKMATWQINGLNDRTGMVTGDATYADTERDPDTGAPTTYQGRFKGERNLDWAYRVNKAAGKTVVVANDFDTMWNGLETAPTVNQNLKWRENEAKAQEQWDRAKAAGTNHLVSIIAPNTLPQTNHWSWNPPNANLVVHDWMFSQNRKDAHFDTSTADLPAEDYGPYPGQSPRTPRYPQPGAGTARVVEARLVTEVLDWGETITAIRIEYSEPVLCDAVEHSVEHANRQTYQMASDREIVNLYVNDSGKKDDYQTSGRYVFINLGLESEDFTSYRDQIVFHTSARIRPRPNPYYLYQAFPVITMRGNVVQPQGITTATSAIRGTLMDTSGLPNIEQMNVWSTEVRMTLDDFRSFRYTNPADGSETKFHLYIPKGYEKKSADLEAIPLVVHFPAGDTAYVDDVLGNANASRQMGSLFTHPDAVFWGSERAQAAQKAFVLTPGPNWNNNYMFIVKALVENLNIDIARIYTISLAAGSTTMWNTILANPGVFAAQISTAYDPYHAYASGNAPYEERLKTAEDRFAQIMSDLPGWYFVGLTDGSGTLSGDPLARKKGERFRDFGYLMVERGFKVDVGWGEDGEQMWNGMLRGKKAEDLARAQISRASANGADHMITNYYPGTVLQTMHWSWNATYSNAAVRGWLYSQTNPDPVGMANIITPRPVYIVTFDPNEGAVDTTNASTGADGKLVSLPTPTRSGYTFDGWFTALDGGTQVTADHVYDADAILYARWTFNGGAIAGITAPELFNADAGADAKLNYSIALSNVDGANVFEIAAKFDGGKLNYIGSSIDIPASYSPTFFVPPAFNAATGEYTATIALMQEGALFTATDAEKILTVSFSPNSDVSDKDRIKGELKSVIIAEVRAPTEVELVSALLAPPDATTDVANYLRFDINNDGRINIADISLIIYNYYLSKEGGAKWNEAKVFDANSDGIVDMADLLIICYYFAQDKATLLYQGHASLRITTKEGKVIYVDPYAGEGYDAPADLILVTHAHSDHTATHLIETKNADCVTITQAEALAGGEYKTFDFGFVTVEAVQAGNNPNHNINACVGYVLTLSDGKSIYVSGDTSTTEQMGTFAARNFDYAFFCCDGLYNMGIEEAAACARLVQAKHSIPYHIVPGRLFDRELAETFNVDNRLIVADGETITID